MYESYILVATIPSYNITRIWPIRSVDYPIDSKFYKQIGILEKRIIKLIHEIGVAQKSEHTDGKCRILGLSQLKQLTISLVFRPKTVHMSTLAHADNKDHLWIYSNALD